MFRKCAALVVVAVFAVAVNACQEEPTAPLAKADQPAFGVGNGFPGPADYQLNIIGVPKDKTAAMDDNNGHRIFVQLIGGQPVCVTDADWAAYQDLIGVPEEDQVDNPYTCTEEEWANALYGGRGKVTGGWDGLDKVNKILLTPNTTDTFGVLDANATDQDGAEFTMPDDVYSEYKVFARALGKPGGKAAITLCANETATTADLNGVETWCSINQAVMTRTKGRPVTEDVTSALFTLTILIDAANVNDAALSVCLDNAGLIDLSTLGVQVADVPIFHSCFEDYFWNYDNNGLKLLQLRFFRVES